MYMLNCVLWKQNIFSEFTNIFISYNYRLNLCTSNKRTTVISHLIVVLDGDETVALYQTDWERPHHRCLHNFHSPPPNNFAGLHWLRLLGLIWIFKLFISWFNQIDYESFHAKQTLCVRHHNEKLSCLSEKNPLLPILPRRIQIATRKANKSKTSAL